MVTDWLAPTGGAAPPPPLSTGHAITGTTTAWRSSGPGVARDGGAAPPPLEPACWPEGLWRGCAGIQLEPTQMSAPTSTVVAMARAPAICALLAPIRPRGGTDSFRATSAVARGLTASEDETASATGSSERPHFVQNRAPGPRDVPHWGQKRRTITLLARRPMGRDPEGLPRRGAAPQPSVEWSSSLESVPRRRAPQRPQYACSVARGSPQFAQKAPMAAAGAGRISVCPSASSGASEGDVGSADIGSVLGDSGTTPPAANSDPGAMN
jgi:hypothetical protein